MPLVWTRTQSETTCLRNWTCSCSEGPWLCCTRSRGLPRWTRVLSCSLSFQVLPPKCFLMLSISSDNSVHLSLGICSSSVVESCCEYWFMAPRGNTRLGVSKHLVITFISGSVHNAVLCVCVCVFSDTLFNTCCWLVSGTHGQQHWNCNWCLSEGYLLRVFPL